MSDLQLDCLRILRDFGPCSNADVGRKVNMPSGVTYSTVRELVAMGLAVHPKKQRWDISAVGRKYLAGRRMMKPEIYR